MATSVPVGAERPIILNLGCGTRTHPRCVNIDWSLYARLARHPTLSRLATHVLGKERSAKLRQMSGVITAHDLRKGIPFPDRSVDAVYLSHVLEHVDRDQAAGFLFEIARVLKPDGAVRIVVPDLAFICEEYLEDYRDCLAGKADWSSHDLTIEPMLEQSVRRQAYATMGSSGLLSKAEALVLGDARKRGETHQWMYDEVSLRGLLERVGFREVARANFKESRLPGWSQILLDVDEAGAEYKPNSLYIEAVAPA